MQNSSINFRMPASFVKHRWLSAFAAADVNDGLLPALAVLYYAWVDKVFKPTFKMILKVCCMTRRKLESTRECYYKSLRIEISYQTRCIARREL